jgi:hypothetical protein
MDIEKFRNLVNDPIRSKADLQQMLKNAIAKNAREFGAIVKVALDSRFPGWDKAKKGGATPTCVSFRGAAKSFPTAKEAYVWLIEQFVKTKPELFTNVNWETEFFAKGKQRNYFGRAPERMFRHSPHLAEDRNNYERLVNGWYVNLNLSNAQKVDILFKFAAVAKLRHGDEWYWKVPGQEQPLDVPSL